MNDARACAQCGTPTLPNRMFVTERGFLCEACHQAIPEPPQPLLSTRTLFGLAFALLPFLVHVNGEGFFLGLAFGGPPSVDLFAAGAGPLALGLGLAGLWSARTATARKGQALALAAAIAALGAYHLVQGFALV